MKNQYNDFNKNLAEALLYPLFILIIMWSVFWIDQQLSADFYTYGVKPKSLEGIKGIFFMPWLHAQRDFNHILSNSLPTAVLFGLLIYFYKPVALRVGLIIWFGTGFLVWYVAENTGSYHIGMSGVIYGLFAFLFLSGILRKHMPLWGISLFVIFLYGSMIWGIFPTEKGISWEGHLFGLLSGGLAAIAFRKQGPQASKYTYEIEQDLGIEPPDLEGEYYENLRIAKERQFMREQAAKERAAHYKALQEQANTSDLHENDSSSVQSPTRIVYIYKANRSREDRIDQPDDQ